MKFEEELKKLLEAALPFKYGIIVAIIGAVFICYGLVESFSEPKKQGISFESTSFQETASESAKEVIFVDIEGAVARPGVYQLSSTARVNDAIIKAGGIKENADQTWIAKNLNLAKLLSDASKLYIPQQYESTFVTSEVSQTILSNNLSININSASAEQLDTLSGVGEVTARKIIQGRPYSSINDLVSKKIVGAKVFDQIKDKITTQ
jgi:competence protein ComEA